MKDLQKHQSLEDYFALKREKAAERKEILKAVCFSLFVLAVMFVRF